MKLIRVAYRATFQHPKEGPLNPANFRISIPWYAEVYQASKDRWLARRPSGRADRPKFEAWPLPHGATAEQMRLNVAEQFETQLTVWEMWGNPGFAGDAPRLLQPNEIEIRENGHVYFKEPK